MMDNGTPWWTPVILALLVALLATCMVGYAASLLLA